MEYARADEGRPWFSAREWTRKHEFGGVWNNELHAVFQDVAPYYDLASDVASLGLYSRWRRQFVSSIDVRPGDKILDICAGTNAIGRGLLQREPKAHVCAMDKSAAMQQVGQDIARSLGFEIESVIGDVHHLPFPDDSFDIVTLGWASRHLQIVDVLSEIKRVLKPGGAFHHCDMLRPKDSIVERLYCAYLKACVTFTALAFRSGPEAWRCRDYFVNSIRRFYSAEEFSDLLFQVGYSDVSCWRAPGGVVAFHKAMKA
jgi:demethylmenaquinone methyltransferase/2-methoxy-6-polyprenyl-1,4-benzoquinol methylase